MTPDIKKIKQRNQTSVGKRWKNSEMRLPVMRNARPNRPNKNKRQFSNSMDTAVYLLYDLVNLSDPLIMLNVPSLGL